MLILRSECVWRDVLAGGSAVIFWVSVMSVALRSGSVFPLAHIWNTSIVNFNFILDSLPILFLIGDRLTVLEFGGEFLGMSFEFWHAVSKPKDWDKITVFEQSGNIPCLQEWLSWKAEQFLSC